MTSIVTGVDGCRGGWVAVTWHPPRAAGIAVSQAYTSLAATRPAATRPAVTRPAATRPAVVSVAVRKTLAELPLSAVTGVDMPIGLLAEGWRTADALARKALGRRGVTVFAVPPRPVWESATYAAANALCKHLTGSGMSVQAWGLRDRILEADQFWRSPPRARDTPPRARDEAQGEKRPGQMRLYEVHPELAFAAMAGAPLPASKHSLEGLAVRRRLLSAAGIELPPGTITGTREHDVLDAAAVAWSAARIAAGTAVTLADPAQRADDGGEIAIRY